MYNEAMNRLRLFSFVWLAVCYAGQGVAAEGQAAMSPGWFVADFLPHELVRDGSVSYQPEIQQAIDQAAATGQRRTSAVGPSRFASARSIPTLTKIALMVSLQDRG